MEGLLEQFRDGQRTGTVAARYGVSRPWLTSWLRHPERLAAYLEARRIGGTALMEDAAELCDNVKPERDEIMKARLQFESRKVLAGAFDPETFGEKRDGVNVRVTMNHGELHLAALRHREYVSLEVAPAVGVDERFPIQRPALPPGTPNVSLEIQSDNDTGDDHVISDLPARTEGSETACKRQELEAIQLAAHRAERLR